MNTSALLRELDPLTHDGRMRRMAELGRAAADPRIADTLDALERGGFYERLLALQSCYGSQDGARALRAVADPSRTLQARALPLLARFAGDTQVEQALHGASARLRVALLRLLRRRGRLASVDACLTALARRDAVALAVLLPFGSEALVTLHAPQARHLGGRLFWKRLAVFHPQFAEKLLRPSLGVTESPDARCTFEATVALTALAPRQPDLALALARALTQHLPLARIALPLQALGQHRPAEVADLLLASADAGHVGLDRSAHRLDLPRLRALLEARPAALAQAHVWFRRLAPAQRASVFPVVKSRWRDREGCISPQLLALLPSTPRRVEARRHLRLHALATRPAQRLPYAALLPWDEALALLEPWLNHPDGELRGLALRTLAGSARYERERLADLLALVRARQHEQDPVRGCMLAGLAALPPSAWRPVHLEDLGAVIRDALSAADLSPGTAAQAEALVVAVLPFHPEWSASWLATLMEERGTVHLGDLENRLSEAALRRLAPALLPVLRSWQTRERRHQLLAVAQSVGRRLPVFTGLADILEDEVQATATQWQAAHALALLFRHCRPRAAALIPRLLKADPSWATQRIVYGHLHRRRQDLLTPFLGHKAYRGRFSTGRTRFLLPLVHGFFRWTQAQQSIFQKALLEMTRASQRPRDTPSVLFAVRRLAALPAVDVAPLAALAEDARPAVQEAALRALGRMDAGQGVPHLLEALGDKRARLAVYALRSAVLAMPVAHALELLRAINPTRKVTVAKEYVRLLGEMPVEAAFRELARLDGTKLHRDVRIALLRALWGHLERPEAWTILERAVESPDGALLDGVVRIPADRLSEAAQQRLLALVVRLLGHPDAVVRYRVLQRCGQAPLPDPERVLLPVLLRAASSPVPDERGAAATALIALCQSRDAEALAEAVTGLLSQRRALRTVVQVLRTSLSFDRRRLEPVAGAVLAALAVDPLTAALRVGLAAEALSHRALGELFAGMAASGELHPDALAAAAEGVTAWAGRPEGGDLEKLEKTLAGSADERLRRLALAALTAQASRTGGWTARRLRRLRAFRGDPAPLVAAAAQFTLPAEEEEPD